MTQHPDPNAIAWTGLAIAYVVGIITAIIVDMRRHAALQRERVARLDELAQHRARVDCGCGGGDAA